MPEPSPALAAAGLYAASNALILVWLGWSVVRIRMRERISIGDGGDPRLTRAMRGMANFTEYAPMALILIALMALMGAPAWLVHLLGVALTAGRLIHGWHFMQADAPGWQRVAGTILTLSVLLLGAVGVAGHALAAL
ncbi:MAG TPA: MAPEG family protein [Paracoccaceae bacterium]|nr:MAPEG family protein [Paracoccaceae bacterium]